MRWDDVGPYDVPAALSGWAGSAVVGPSALSNSTFLAILASVHGVPQLPFPGFPPVNSQPAGPSSCGVPRCWDSVLSGKPRHLLRQRQVQQDPELTSTSTAAAFTLGLLPVLCYGLHSSLQEERSSSRQSRGRRISFSESKGESEPTQQ